MVGIGVTVAAAGVVAIAVVSVNAAVLVADVKAIILNTVAAAIVSHDSLMVALLLFLRLSVLSCCCCFCCCRYRHGFLRWECLQQCDDSGNYIMAVSRIYSRYYVLLRCCGCFNHCHRCCCCN